jgi:hypothetical protein
MSPETKPTVEELWEQAGYLAISFNHARAGRASTSALAALESAISAALGASPHDALYDPSAYERGKARWRAEHPEVRA